MGTLSARGKTTAVNANKAAATHAALFFEGTEVTGGTYARQAITWGDAVDAVVPLTGTPYSFDIPAGTSVDEIRFMEGAEGADYQGSEAVSPAEVYASAGTFELTAGSLTIADPA